MEFCRERHFTLPQPVFNILTCSTCFQFLFPKNSELKSKGLFLEATVNSRYPNGSRILADITNSTIANFVCKTLKDGSDCGRWRSCCLAAIECCKTQLQTPVSYNGTFCPRIWDGYGCFGDTLSNTREYIQCPSYIENGITDAKGFKDCTDNGTWFIHPETNYTWTDYSQCVPIQHTVVFLYVSVACNIISLLLLIPSCAIFVAFRQLRSQHRIKLHICFFTSFIMVAVVTIMWDFLLYNKRQRVGSESELNKNSHGCKILYALLRYTMSSTFFWMFCEGFYLHRLIVHAFKVPKGLLGYYIMGWGVSAVPVIIYSIIRITDEELDQRCWVNHAGAFEWIMYIPSLLCLVLNVLFFINILRILLTQIQSHPNEPSNYRRALKATFVLIPLFGIQLGLVMYRPVNKLWFEIVRAVVQYSQGAIVSLVFCIFNGEVHSHLKSCLRKQWPSFTREDHARLQSTMSGTQYSQVSSGRRGTQQNEHYIPLSTVSDDQFRPNGHVG